MARVIQRTGRLAVLLSAAFLFARAAFAQGCSLCYANAAATGPRGTAALRHGILTLMIPPMLIFGGILLTLYRRRPASPQDAAEATLPLAPLPEFRDSFLESLLGDEPRLPGRAPSGS